MCYAWKDKMYGGGRLDNGFCIRSLIVYIVHRKRQQYCQSLSSPAVGVAELFPVKAATVE